MLHSITTCAITAAAGTARPYPADLRFWVIAARQAGAAAHHPGCGCFARRLAGRRRTDGLPVLRRRRRSAGPRSDRFDDSDGRTIRHLLRLLRHGSSADSAASLTRPPGKTPDGIPGGWLLGGSSKWRPLPPALFPSNHQPSSPPHASNQPIPLAHCQLQSQPLNGGPIPQPK